jgi:hypothetical protein
MPASVDISPGETRVATSYIQWSSVWVGAFIAAAVSFVLVTFGSAIGLAVAPLAPTWRSPTVLFSILSGLWVLAIAMASIGLGGYVAGRARTTWHIAHDREVEVRDGVHGLTVWALALTLGILFSGLSAALLAAAPVNPGGIARIAADGPITYEVDRLFRPAQGAVVPTPALRDQASRGLLAASSGGGFTADDRADLVRLVAETTRLSPEAAVTRVDQSIVSVREKIRAARHAAIILAFITAASAAASAAMAWQAARVGGRHRDAVA